MAVTELTPRICRRKLVLRGTCSGRTNPRVVFHDEMKGLFEEFSDLFDDGVLRLQGEKRSESKDTSRRRVSAPTGAPSGRFPAPIPLLKIPVGRPICTAG